jgi:hypothetical protein
MTCGFTAERVTNSAGAAERRYLIAVFSTGNPTPQYGATTIARLSSVVWADLG